MCVSGKCLTFDHSDSSSLSAITEGLAVWPLMKEPHGQPFTILLSQSLDFEFPNSDPSLLSVITGVDAQRRGLSICPSVRVLYFDSVYMRILLGWLRLGWLKIH